MLPHKVGVSSSPQLLDSVYWACKPYHIQKVCVHGIKMWLEVISAFLQWLRCTIVFWKISPTTFLFLLFNVITTYRSRCLLIQSQGKYHLVNDIVEQIRMIPVIWKQWIVFPNYKWIDISIYIYIFSMEIIVFTHCHTLYLNPFHLLGMVSKIP